MGIRDHMDRLLAAAAEQGREPECLLVREEDWAAFRSEYDLVADPAGDGVNAYKGVPVELYRLRHEGVISAMLFAKASEPPPLSPNRP